MGTFRAREAYADLLRTAQVAAHNLGYFYEDGDVPVFVEFKMSASSFELTLVREGKSFTYVLDESDALIEKIAEDGFLGEEGVRWAETQRKEAAKEAARKAAADAAERKHQRVLANLSKLWGEFAEAAEAAHLGDAAYDRAKAYWAMVLMRICEEDERSPLEYASHQGRLDFEGDLRVKSLTNLVNWLGKGIQDKDWIPICRMAEKVAAEFAALNDLPSHP